MDALNITYKEWFDNKKQWLCKNTSRLDEIFEHLIYENIITTEDSRQIEAVKGRTLQFVIVYERMVKAGVGKIDVIINVLGKARQEDVQEEFIKFKNEQISPRGFMDMTLNEINHNYKSWLHSKMNWFCRNSSRLDEILAELQSKNLITILQKNQIESGKGYTEQFSLLYDLLKQIGVSHLDSIIEVLGNSRQEDILEEFIKFKHENTLNDLSRGKRQARTSEDKPLVNFLKPKKPHLDVSNEDIIDFVHNMQPLKVVVRDANRFMDMNHRNMYKMRSNPRGYALIINNIHFHDEKRNRSGAAEKDREYMQELLQQLNYGVTLKEDVAFIDVKEIVQEFKQKFADNTVDSCIVVVMSHGGNNTIEMVDGEHIYIWQDIIYKFDNQNCPQLVGKPKIFIIQACQNFEQNVPRTGTDSTLPRVSDMLVCFSTIPGFVSHRDRYLGSWYIYCLTKVFSEDAHALEITKLLQKVANEAMMSLNNEEDLKQVSTYQPILFKDFYFNPGI